MFVKKLAFLMNITNMSNATLAKAISVDASAISRFRSGKRRLPKHPDFLPSMANFLAKSMTEEYQKKSVADQITPNIPWPESAAEASDIICAWLLEPDKEQLCPIERKLSDTAEINSAFSDLSVSQVSNSPLPRHQFFYGVEGLREAMLLLFKSSVASGEPRDILLFTEEEPGWFFDNSYFEKECTQYFEQVLQLGCRVKIIYNSAHSLTLMEDVSKWLSAFLNGSALLYYSPKTGNALHRRTLFIAAGLLAVESTVVGKRGTRELVQLITDETAVSALENEYNKHLSFCRPLMELLQMERDFISADRLVWND